MVSLERHSALWLCLVLLLALILRIIALLNFSQSIYSDFLLWDERLYQAWAEGLAKGEPIPRAVSAFAPLPAYVMAFLYRVFSPDPLYVRLLNILLGVLTCLLLYLTGKEMAGKPTGLISALVGAVLKPFIFYSMVLLKASMAVFLFTLTLYLLLLAMKRPSTLKGLFLGMVIGLLVNVQSNCVALILFLPLPIVWVLIAEKASRPMVLKALVSYALGLAMVLTPFAVRNYRISGEPGVTGSQAGFNLYRGNNTDHPYPYYRPVAFATSSPLDQEVQFTIEASRRVGRKLGPSEASSYWTRETIRRAVERPGAFLWKILQKALVLFQPYQPSDHYSIAFMRDFVPFFRFPFPGLELLLPLGMAGMAVKGMRSRQGIALASIFCLYGLTLVGSLVNDRYRLPLVAILIPFGLMGIAQAASWIKEKYFRGIVLYLGVLAAFFVIAALPVQGSRDVTAYYNTHAIVLDSKGREGEAMKFWEASSDMEGLYSDFARLSLAGKHLLRRDMETAYRYLEKIPDDSYAAAQKNELLGDAMMLQGKRKEALSAYEKSVHINSGERRVRSKVIRILWDKDRQRALEEFDRLEYLNTFYEPGF